MKRHYLLGLGLALSYVSVGTAQQYPIMDEIANKIIAKYQTTPSAAAR